MQAAAIIYICDNGSDTVGHFAGPRPASGYDPQEAPNLTDSAEFGYREDLPRVFRRHAEGDGGLGYKKLLCHQE